jgi:8-oxo-dGTP diphosphatase
MTRYVLGFLFSEDMNQVVLILKNRPKWQAGLLNGVGGKVEENESLEQAMQREFKEETNVDIDSWTGFAYMEGPDYTIHCFSTVGDVSMIETITDEPVMVIPIDRLHTMTIVHNLRWLIPLALDNNVQHCNIAVL